VQSLPQRSRSIPRSRARTKDFLANIFVHKHGRIFYTLEQTSGNLCSDSELDPMTDILETPLRVNTRSVNHASQTSLSAEILNAQACLPGTFAKRSHREKYQVSGHFETSPTALEPSVPKTAEIRRCYNETSGIRTKAVSAVAKQSDWVNRVLNHVVKGNNIELVVRGYV
jgi:hypothetical protein